MVETGSPAIQLPGSSQSKQPEPEPEPEPEPVSFTPEVTKNVSGKGAPSEEFEFEIEGTKDTSLPDGYKKTALAADKGTAVFGELTYTSEGGYTYEIWENEPEEATEGMSYSKDKITLTVNVGLDEKENALKIDSAVYKIGTKETNTIVNIYEKPAPKPVTYSPKVNKEVSGKDAPSEEFEFEIKGIKGTSLPGDYDAKKKAEAGGSASFDNITYTATGDYTYELWENVPEDPTEGMSYSTDKITLTVSVGLDEKENKLRIDSAKYMIGTKETDTIVNIYEKPAPSPVGYIPKVNKAVEGENAPFEEFEFEIKGVKETSLPEGYDTTEKTEAGGTAVFTTLTYKTPGTYTYEIWENEPEEATEGMSYSKDRITLTVNVGLDEKTNALKIDSAGYMIGTKESDTITNTYEKPAPKPVTYSPRVNKEVSGKGAPFEEFEFEIKGVNGTALPEKYDAAKKAADKGTAEFAKITYTEAGDYTYEIKENKPEDPTPGMSYSDVPLTLTVNVGLDEKDNSLFIRSATYKIGTKETDTITNVYKEPLPDTGSLMITKTIKGDITEEEAAGALTFKITGPGYEETFTLDKFDHDAGTDKYVLTLNDLAPGEYTVEETTYDIEGRSVTVKYTVGEEEPVKGTAADITVVKNEITDIAFEDSYKKDTGAIKITKTIKGDVTKEEAEGTLTFKIKGPGKFEQTYGLDVFEYNKDEDIYVLELNGLEPGEYTVEETTYDIGGRSVTVKYTVDSGETVKGSSADVTVVKDKTVTAAFEDDYKNDTGSLKITKTIRGDITEEEAKGALTFKVTGPESYEETFTLDKFEHEEGTSVYTLELKDLKPGIYTVEETTYDIEGKSVTVKYSVNSKDAVRGNTAEASVVKDKTTEVGFEDDYKNSPKAVIMFRKVVEDRSTESVEGSKYGLFTLLGGSEIKLDESITDADGIICFEKGDNYTVEFDKEYILKELDAPEGYYVSRNGVSVKVVLDEESNPKLELVDDGSGTAQMDENGNIKWLEPETKYSFSKTDITGSKEIPGAELILVKGTDPDGTDIVDSWISKDAPHEINGKLICGETYTLVEKNSPAGFVVAEAITFLVPSDMGPNENEPVLIQMRDDTTKTNISITDGSGKEIGGAHVEIRDEEGNVIDKWISEEGKDHETDGILEKGKTYTLAETQSPEGYEKAEPVRFTVREDGEILKVQLKHTPVKKQDNTEPKKETDTNTGNGTGKKTGKAVNTGDTTDVTGWTAVLVSAIAALAALILIRRRKDR